MRSLCTILIIVAWGAGARPALGQQDANCFLEDFAPRIATIPPYEDVPKVATPWTIRVTVDAADTLGKISQYIFGTAVAVWVGPNQNNPTLVSHLGKVSPALIRFPGGSWSDIYFWNQNPGDLPVTIPDGQNNGQPIALNPQVGPFYNLSPAQYYDLRAKVGTQGMITINYGYARYGLSQKPVEQAAHYAAEWVRYDSSRTRFWELGNENAGLWEAGYMIDTTTNKDGQPRIVTGELYGKHFKIFADSMRAAAAERGATIFIGGQILHFDGTNSGNVADRKWNEGFFREAGTSPDFYVVHNYFGSSGAATNLLNEGSTVPKQMMDFIQQDIALKSAAPRPVALTEWNIRWDLTAGNIHRSSFINGMQAVIVWCELAKLNYGMAARWLVSNWESDGMFYNGGTSGIPLWNPRPDVFYMHYARRFMGDHLVSASVPGSQVVLAYASTFSTGHIGIIVVNKSKTSFTASLTPDNYSFGDRFYVYSLTGGTDNGDFSQVVNVNDEGASAPAWGPPIDQLDSMKAYAYPTTGNEIKFPLPGRSVQFILLEPGSHSTSVESGDGSGAVREFALFQNFPNPFNPTTEIRYAIPAGTHGPASLQVYDILGRDVATLVNEVQQPGHYTVRFDAAGLPSGAYFYRLKTESSTATKMMLLLR